MTKKSEENAPEGTPKRALAAEAQRIYGQVRELAAGAYERVLPLIGPSETRFLVGLAVVIGLTTGILAYFFDRLIEIIFHFSFPTRPTALAEAPLLERWRYVLFPVVGGLLSGPLILRYAKEERGEGVPLVLRAMAERGGRMKGRIAALKALASAITLGTGGSAGREGPIVHLGASIGSRLAQVFRLPAVTLRTMAAAGAASGIGAAFNAPLGGMAFAMEVILGEVSGGPFAMVVLSTVVASAVSRGLHGPHPFFQIPPYRLMHWSELFLYFGLGMAAGVLAKVFQKMFYRLEHAFEHELRVDPYWRAAVGGLLVGAIGFFIPGVLGPGYEIMDQALNAGFVPGTLLILLGFKMLATSLTLGSGGSGGTLMPSLYLGCMLGSLMGQAYASVLPIVDPRAYALVGMAAVFAGVVHAPLTGILILFELTGDYPMILPLMIASVTAYLTAQFFSRDSLYVEKLRVLGVRLTPRGQTDVLIATPISAIMTRKVRTLAPDFPIGKLGRHFNRMGLSGFPVVDGDEKLLGMVTFAEAKAAYRNEPPPPPETPVSKIMRAPGQPLYPDDPASEAARRMDQNDIDRLPIVDRDDPRLLVGIVSQKDLLQLYAKRVAN